MANGEDRAMNRPVTIAYLIGSLETGGAEGQLMELLRRLDRTRFQPRLILLEAGIIPPICGLADEVCVLGVPIEPESARRARGSRALKAFLRLCRYLRRTRPDILHAHLPQSCILGLTAGILCQVPVVIGSRRSLSAVYRDGCWTRSLTDRLSTGFSHFMIGNAEAVTRELIDVDGLFAAKTATIYNGVDTDRFRPGRSESWRTRYGWNNGEVVFGMVANFFGYKRHVDLVEAAAILHRKYPTTRFVMAGQDRGEMPAVMAAIAGRDLCDVVQVVPGTSRPEDLYAALDVLVCCSDTEGFSNVILEGMATGKAVIATDVGGNIEAVADGITGFLVPRRSPSALAQAAERLVQDQELRQVMGRNGRQRVEAQFSVLKMVRAHERLYAQLLERKGLWSECLPPASDLERAAPSAGSDSWISTVTQSEIAPASPPSRSPFTANEHLR